MTQPAKIIPFAFEEHLVRVHKPNGEPWFVGRDVCRVLDIKNESQALARLDPDERQDGVCITDPTGRPQEVIVVSEAGVYRLIFTSRKPEAERFKKWIVSEVLPSIRKHGSYTVPGRDGGAGADPLTEFPTADGPLAEHMAKLATLRECRMIHGPRAAARLWRRLGMPAVTESAVEEMDEGRRCLAHLLETVVMDSEFGDPFTLRVMIEAALSGDDAAATGLKERFHLMALEAPEEGLFVPNCAENAARLYAGSPWSKGRHIAALRRLPGATAMRKSIGMQYRGTFIPAGVIDGMPVIPRAEGGGNVVPLHPGA